MASPSPTSSTQARQHSQPAQTHSPPSKSSTSHSTSDEKDGSSHVVVNVRPIPAHMDSISPSSPPKPLNPLETFHSALGIPAPKPPKAKRTFFGRKKPLPDPEHTPQLSKTNQGVYRAVASCERWARIRYHFCNTVVTISMFLQIIVGASVTAFGAGSANHVIITVFGAANTALASLLAVLKSQGLPNRLRQDWNGWRELREYIEEKEREIEMVVSGRLEDVKGGVGEKELRRLRELDVWEEIKAIEARYNAVRLTMEANRPDTYITVPAVSR